MNADTSKATQHSSSSPELECSSSGLGDRLRHIRTDVVGESQKEFAARMGVGLSTLQRYETQEREPDVSFIAELARQTGTSIEWIVTGRGSAREMTMREPTPEYATKPPTTPPIAELNAELLGTVMKDVDELLKNVGFEMPLEKRALVYALVYNTYLRKTGQIDLVTLMKLVA